MDDPSQWQVMIVDDEPSNVGVLELVLDFYHAKTRLATSGQECLDLLAKERPSFLLVDIQMPGMTGYELLHHIRKHPRWHDIPVIAVTAHAMRGDEEQIIRAGFNGYIPKPISVTTLVDDLRHILQSNASS